MLSPAPATWTLRGVTFALWALAAGSAAYWGLKLSGSTRPVAAPIAAPRQVPPADAQAIARLLGGSPVLASASGPAPAVPLATRFQLLGVAAGASSGAGAAVISVDGKPARTFRVGSPVDEGYVLKSVRGRQALIAQGDGQVVATLELPQPKFDPNRPAPLALPAVPSLAPPQPPGMAAAPGMTPPAPPAEPQAPKTAPR